MKHQILRILAFTLLAIAASAPKGVAQVPGGYTPVAATDEQALAAAKFAVGAQEPKLVFQSLDKAEQQVVAGKNYRLTLKVKLNGATRGLMRSYGTNSTASMR